MRKACVGLVLAAWMVTSSGCGDSTTPAGGGPGAPQPPGAPEQGPEMLKATKSKTARH